MTVYIQKLDNPIFIIGCPRSGTTKLASILNRHSLIASATETHFFNFVSKQKYDWKNFSVNEFKKLLQESRILDFITLAELSSEVLVNDFLELENHEKNIHLTLEDSNKKKVFDLLVKNYLLKKNKSRICEKTPQHIQNIEEILRIYPQARFILMVRDGRDTVNSLLKMPWRPKGLLNNARFWSHYMKLAREASLRSEVITIKYENLLTRPQDVLTTICNFIEEKYEDSLLDVSTEPDNLFSAWESSWKHKSKQELDSSRIDAWTRELNSDDKKILEWFLHKDLLEFGYHSELPNLNFSQWLKIINQCFNLAWRKMFRLISHITN
jgi:Sulfotransferase family